MAGSLLVLAGCANTHQVHDDPIKGEIHPQQQPANMTYGPTLAPNANPSQHTGTPPLPADGSVSTMSLASMSGSRPLAINASQTTTGSSPAPRVQAVEPDPPSQVASFSATKQTQDILQAQLRARGVVWQKQEAVADGVKFTCIAPNRNSAESSKIYEATAHDYVSAVQAILVQIDRN